MEQQLESQAAKAARVAIRHSRWASKAGSAQRDDVEAETEAAEHSQPRDAEDRLTFTKPVEEGFNEMCKTNAATLACAASCESDRLQTANKATQEIASKIDSQLALGPEQQLAVENIMKSLTDISDPIRLTEASAKLDAVLKNESASAQSIVSLSATRQEQYMEMLQQQSSDRDKFQQQMAEQLVEIQKLCSAQFASFEIARREEQRSTVARHLEETQHLYTVMDDAESAALESQLSSLSDRQEQLRILRDEQSDHFREMQTMLDLEVNTLDLLNEEQRAQFMIDAERLQLRHNLLQLEAPDQKRALATFKRSIAQAQDLLSSLKENHAKEQTAFEAENRALSERYMKSTHRLRELQSRNTAIKSAARIKLEEVKRMKQEELTTLKSELDQTNTEIVQKLTGNFGAGTPSSDDKPWAMLQQVLTRTCDTWRQVDGSRKQLDRMHTANSEMMQASRFNSPNLLIAANVH